MHISQLSEVSKLNAELTSIRAQLAAVDDTGLQFRSGNGAFVNLSDATKDTFKKLALIELLEKEEKLVDQLEDLGVDADELPADTCCGAARTTESMPSEAVLSALFGSLGFHTGGVVGRRS